MSAPWSTTADGIDTFDCELKDCGRTTRMGMTIHVEGTALHGPATFPLRIPQLSEDEVAYWRPLKGWLIEPAKPQRKRGTAKP